jgi:hypothetical protein
MLSFVLATDAGAAPDTPDSLQQEINAILATTDGGVQISSNEIAWEGGQVLMALPLPGEAHAPPSSKAAQALQAKAAGLSLTQVEKAKTNASRAAGAAADGAAADDEPLPPGETEPADTTPTAADNCPTEIFGNDWYCFYQYKNFGGRRLQWNAAHQWPDSIYFDSYDFENRTSSWSNKGGKHIYVIDGRCDDEYSTLLWRENPHTRSSSVSTRADNRADCFHTS